jgi:hypothetical protein
MFLRGKGEMMTRWMSLAILVCVLVLGIFLMDLFKPKQESTQEVIGQNQTLPDHIEDWYEFTAPEGTFKVLMPGLPHHATESNQESKSNEMRHHELYVASKEDGTLFSVYLVTFPQRKKEELNPEFLLSFIKEMLDSNQTNKVQYVKPITFNKINAVDFSVENQEAMIDGKAFFKDNTLYVLSTTAKMDRRNKKEYEFFVNSFQLGTPKQL